MYQWKYLYTILLLVSFTGCSSNEVIRKLRKPEEYLQLDGGSEFLKVHYRNGDLSVFSNWKTYNDDKLIIGEGVLYNANREIIKSGTDSVSFSRIALLETNTILQGDNAVAMGLFTGGTIGVAIYCAMNPKACFGSCPTFYAWDGKRYTLIAEGFSSSILPSLEARDIDALYRAVPTSKNFELRMTNEALETHLVRQADILIAKKTPGGRILHMTNNTLCEGLAFFAPIVCKAPEDSPLAKIISFDESERYSLADSNDLSAKETIDLAFEKNPNAKIGLVLGFRQSLLTTFLFYQGLAYLGDSAGKVLANIESHPELQKILGDPFKGLLGGIEVFVLDKKGKWQEAGEFYEAGPIAHNVQTLLLPDSISDYSHIRLRMTKGMWRINYIAETILGETVIPKRLHPFSVLKDTILDNKALSILQTGSSHVVSMPGDKWILRYELPENFWDYDLFLDASGYYLEWMRKEWLAETNAKQAAFMFNQPANFLRQQAPVFKKLEPEMENTFWSSRYVRH
jgi:hypothetical protein